LVILLLTDREHRLCNAVNVKQELLSKVFNKDTWVSLNKLTNLKTEKAINFFKEKFKINLSKKLNQSKLEQLIFSFLGMLDSVILDCMSRLISEDKADDCESLQFKEGKQRPYITPVHIRISQQQEGSLYEIVRTSSLRNELIKNLITNVDILC
jgi:hypothetical protein